MTTFSFSISLIEVVWYIVGHCRSHLLGQSFVKSDSESCLIQNQDHCGSRRHSFTVSNINNNCFSTFISTFYSFYSAENISVCTPSQGTKRENYSYEIQHQMLKCRLWREINTYPSISSLKGRLLPIFRRKMDRPNTSEMDIEVLIPVKHLYFSLHQNLDGAYFRMSAIIIDSFRNSNSYFSVTTSSILPWRS